jgi:hypothetical protein
MHLRTAHEQKQSEKIVKTTPNVFIIESLNIDDEKHDRFEGKFLSHILKLTGAKACYSYVRTPAQFRKALVQFKKSGFRYLHISSHANKQGLGLTEGELTIDDLANLLGPVLQKRRIFFSACQFVTRDLAEALFNETECYSAIGPFTKVGFDEAAIFWASLYHVMLRDEAGSMKFKELKKQVSVFSKLYRVKIKYFRSSKSVGFREVQL